MVNIKQKRVRISKALYDEIIYNYEALKEAQKKKRNIKKERITIIQASEDIARYLNKKRLKLKKNKKK